MSIAEEFRQLQTRLLECWDGTVSCPKAPPALSAILWWCSPTGLGQDFRLHPLTLYADPVAESTYSHDLCDMFAAAGILHPIGSGFLQSVPELVRAIAHLQEKCPELQQVVIKLNEAFSGEGSAVLDLRPLRPFSSLHAPDHLQRIENSPEEMAFQAPNETWVSYRQRFNTLDGIVEAFVAGNVKQSPSVQGCITPKGGVEIVSTHGPLLKPFIAKPSAFSILRCPPLA